MKKLLNKIDTLKQQLKETIFRCRALAFDDFASLDQESWIELIDQPNENIKASYCQIEVQLLYRYFENKTEVLHLLVVGDDCSHEFGADLFIYKGGRFRCDGIYAIIGGVPQKVESIY